RALRPLDEVATALRTLPPAVRSDRSRDATSGRPKAAATWACVRVRVQVPNGLPPPALHGSGTDRRYGTAEDQTSSLFSVAPPSEAYVAAVLGIPQMGGTA